MKRYYRKSVDSVKQFVLQKILHADDTPHRLAMGVGLGIFVAWTPTIGFQMIIVLLLASLFKANKAVGVPLVWISNPFTLIPIYYPNYLLGRWLMSVFIKRPYLDKEQFAHVLGQLQGLADSLKHLHKTQFLHNLTELFTTFLKVSLDLWVGSIIIGLVLGIVSYIGTYRLIVWYRIKHGRSTVNNDQSTVDND